MINLLNKTNDFIKSEKIKAFPLVCSKYLSSRTGLGRSGHDQITTFGPISHASGSKKLFLTKFINDSVLLCWRSLKTRYFHIVSKNPNNL